MPPKTAAVTGTIGVIAQETGRYTQFAVALAQLRHPGWNIQTVLGYDAAYGRHRLAETFTGDWLMFLDDDHSFQPDLLERLLAHRCDIVAPLYLKRGQGFRPTAYDLDDPDRPFDYTAVAHGLHEVSVTGTSGMLIHRRVFDTIGPPFFRAGHVPGMAHAIGEDVDFCQRARHAGFRVHVDTSIPFGHYAACMVTPVPTDDGWRVSLLIGDQVLSVPLQQEHLS